MFKKLLKCTLFLSLFNPLISYSQSNYLPPQRTAKMNWGVCGHATDQSAYYDPGTVDRTTKYMQQINYLKKGNMEFYRMGVNYDASNKISFLSPTVVKESDYQLIFSLLKTNGLKPLVVIGSNDFPNFSLSEIDNYKAGLKEGEEVAQKFGSEITYYELSNELDNKCFPVNKDANGNIIQYSGAVKEEFDQDKIRKTSAYLRGMNAGIKSIDEDAKTILDYAGSLHHGFWDALKTYTPNLGFGVCGGFTEFDILGWHIYSSIPDITQSQTCYNVPSPLNLLQLLDSKFPDKEIWVTEMNYIQTKDYNDQTPEERKAQNDWLKLNLEHLNKFKGQNQKSKVTAIFLYELYSEHFGPNNPESNFGLIQCADSWCLNTTEKEVYHFYKLRIENYNKGIEDYVKSLYADWGCTLPDAAGLAYWTDKMKNANDRRAVTQQQMYEGYVENFIRTAYSNLFDRAADQGGVDYALNNFKSNSNYRFEDFLAGMLTSTEFWNRAINNTSNLSAPINYTNRTHCEMFVKRFYQRVFGRDADPGGLAYWTDYLYNNHSSTVHYNFVMDGLFSKEYVDIFITSQFYSLFESTDDPGDFKLSLHNAMVNRTKNQRDVILDLVCSDAYWNKALKNGYDSRTQPGAKVISQAGGVLVSKTDPAFFSPYTKPVVQYTYPINNKACMFTY